MLRYNKKEHAAAITVLHTTVTDHYTVRFSFSKLENKVSSELIKTKTKVDFEKIHKNLQEKNLAELLLYNDHNLLTDTLIHKFRECVDSITTIVKIPKCKRIIKSWISPGILRCINHRNKLQRNLRSDPFDEI